MINSKKKILANFDDLIGSATTHIDEAIKENKVDWYFIGVWKEATIRAIDLTFPNDAVVNEFRSINFTSLNLNPTQDEQNIAYMVGLISARNKLVALRYTVDRWLDDEPEVAQVKSPPFVFIAHGGKHSAAKLNKIKEFLLAIGAQPLIVEELPAMGLSANDKVKNYMGIANVSIALITAEDKLDSGQLQGRHNISHEIGLMQNSPNLADRIIILKENGVVLPSNYSQFIYQSFSKKSMDDSFIRIAKEFKAYGFI